MCIRRIVAAAAFLSIALGCGTPQQKPEPVGKASNFAMSSVHGKRVVLFDMLQALPDGGWLILNFTSVTCQPCKKEIPELAGIVRKSGGKSALACVYSETDESALASAKSLGIEENAYHDALGEIKKSYEVNKIPVTFVIAKDGAVFGRFDGYNQANIKRIRSLVLD